LSSVIPDAIRRQVTGWALSNRRCRAVRVLLAPVPVVVAVEAMRVRPNDPHGRDSKRSEVKVRPDDCGHENRKAPFPGLF
jgi:hypothetical protein